MFKAAGKKKKGIYKRGRENVWDGIGYAGRSMVGGEYATILKVTDSEVRLLGFKYWNHC